jgi:hypothetical protein
VLKKAKVVATSNADVDAGVHTHVPLMGAQTLPHTESEACIGCGIERGMAALKYETGGPGPKREDKQVAVFLLSGPNLDSKWDTVDTSVNLHQTAGLRVGCPPICTHPFRFGDA